MDLAKVIKVVVISEFEDASKAFNDNPNGIAWGRLETAMWARQAVSSPDTMEKAVASLPGVGVGKWLQTLNQIHKGKSK